ncbi:hypothetical protein HY969_02085 [Candidatus Kaiserbacteria bacterium]|nr:hypothetical protein [Candidatus Kaiserbacteria bacterium]
MALEADKADASPAFKTAEASDSVKPAESRFSQGIRWLRTKSGEGLAALGKKYDRWQASRAADHTIRQNGRDINTVHSEIEGIDIQTIGKPVEEVMALRQRQSDLMSRLSVLTQDRQQAAGVLSNYYGEKIERPMKEAEACEAAITGLRERRDRIQQTLDKARDHFNIANTALSRLRQEGKCTDAERAERITRLQKIAERIQDCTSQLDLLNPELSKTQQQLSAVRTKHRDKITFAQSLRSMREDGTHGTLAAPRAKEETTVEKSPDAAKAIASEAGSSGSASETLGSVSDADIASIVGLYSRVLGGLPSALRRLLDRFSGQKEIRESQPTDELVDQWNELLDMPPKTSEISKIDKQRLVAMQSKMDLFEFGMALSLKLDTKQEEISNGMLKLAEQMTAKSDERLAA